MNKFLIRGCNALTVVWFRLAAMIGTFKNCDLKLAFVIYDYMQRRRSAGCQLAVSRWSISPKPLQQVANCLYAVSHECLKTRK